MEGKLAPAPSKFVAGLTLITILGVFLYLSPLRGNTVAIVGVFASLSAVIIALLATVKIEIINVEEESAGMGKLTLEEKDTYKPIGDTAKILDFSYTNMYLRKTDEFEMEMYSSENQITLSSHYAPRRAHLVKRQPKRNKPDDQPSQAHVS